MFGVPDKIYEKKYIRIAIRNLAFALSFLVASICLSFLSYYLTDVFYGVSGLFKSQATYYVVFSSLEIGLIALFSLGLCAFGFAVWKIASVFSLILAIKIWAFSALGALSLFVVFYNFAFYFSIVRSVGFFPSP